MIRAAVALGRIAMARHDDFSLQIPCARHCRVKVVQFKPEKHAISIRRDVRISDAPMVVFHIPVVQLENQPVTDNKPLVLLPAMRTLTAKQALIPATARLDVMHTNKRLWTHNISIFHISVRVKEMTGLRFASSVR